MRFVRKNSIFNFLYEFSISYPSPGNLNIFYNFGFLALMILVSQIVTGVFLAMHYIPHIDYAFSSVEHIMRDVNYGFFIRYLHANGASFFFFFVYIHISKGLYYSSYSYPRELVWIIGVFILLVMIITAFLGYVLPWGQMSFWAATVITNLASAIPVIGHDLVIWLWGGFSVDNATLERFFSLHYLLPFIIFALVIFHLIALHTWGSSNPVGVNFKLDTIYFTPFFMIKDFFGFFLAFIFLFYFLFFNPNYLGHTDNYILANPLNTPPHIVPEWYFLLFYAILRSIPNKLLGVVALLGAILVLLFVPVLVKLRVRSFDFAWVSRVFFWIFIINSILLAWIGGKSVDSPYYESGQVLTFFYFFYFVLLMPVLTWLDKFMVSKSWILFRSSFSYGMVRRVFKALAKFLLKNRSVQIDIF